MYKIIRIYLRHLCYMREQWKLSIFFKGKQEYFFAKRVRIISHRIHFRYFSTAKMWINQRGDENLISLLHVGN